MILNLPVAPQDISRASVDSKLRRTQVCITPDFNRCRMTMNKARSTSQEWDFVSRGKGISEKVYARIPLSRLKNNRWGSSRLGRDRSMGVQKDR
jgi:hypothetical protein